MRILVVTIGTCLLLLVGFWTIKFWGQSKLFVDYNHPLLTKTQTEPYLFVLPRPENISAAIIANDNLYLSVATTLDEKLVTPTKVWSKQEKQIRYQNYEDLKASVLLLENYKDQLRNKIIIFNISENAAAGHEIFIDNLKKLGLDKGENVIITTPFESVAKAIKEISPALLFGTSQPEILKLLAMDSMWLIEATNIRADFLIHPLQIRNQTFFTNSILNEMHRRHKRIIIGPELETNLEVAKSLSPFGIIIQK